MAVEESPALCSFLSSTRDEFEVGDRRAGKVIHTITGFEEILAKTIYPPADQ